MQGVPLSPIGLDLGSSSLADIGPSDVVGMRALLAEHGVLVAHEQEIDDIAFERMLRLFGEPVFTVGETPLPDHPDLNVITNVGRSMPPRSTFHVDTSYVSRPPAYTALRAVTVPGAGGNTLFSDQYRAARTLPQHLLDRAKGRFINHVVTGVDPGPGQEHAAQHPIFRPHPLTGRIALYLTTPARCASVSGLGPAEGEQLVHALYAHSTRPDNVYRHVWRAGDVVLWDNSAVMHRADHEGVVGDRVMHRGMVDGYGHRPDNTTQTGNTA